MAKLTYEQERLLGFLKAGRGSRQKTAVFGLFSKATIESLLRKDLIKDDYSIGYYSIKAKATVNNLSED